MAVLDSLQLVIVLDDKMATDFEKVYLPQNKSSMWLENEQTEPLNLSLDETMNRKNREKEEEEEKDVIFVKEYKRRTSKAKCQKSKTLRRNPARKARGSNRFFDFVEKSYGQDENPEEFSEPEFEDTRVEDCDDWKMEKVPRKGRSKVFFTKRKRGTKLGKRKSLKSKADGKNKENLQDLQNLIQSNFTLAKKYIDNIKTTKTDEIRQSKRIDNAFHIAKNQAMFVAAFKGLRIMSSLQ